MKPNNISDVEKLFDEKWHKWFKRGVIEREEVKQFYRSQIEQLLGRIDTEKKKINPGSVNGDLQVKKTGYNQKSSEIANHILEMKK